MQITTYIEVTDKGASWLNKQKFADAVTSLSIGMYSVTVEKCYNKRTSKQNAGKFGVIYKACKEVLDEVYGEDIPIYSDNDNTTSIHRLLLTKCAPNKYKEAQRAKWVEHSIVCHDTGEILCKDEFRLSSKHMTTVEEMEFIENIRRFMFEYFGAVLPEFEKQK